MVSRLLSNFKNAMILILICAECINLIGYIKACSECFMNIASLTFNTTCEGGAISMPTL